MKSKCLPILLLLLTFACKSFTQPTLPDVSIKAEQVVSGLQAPTDIAFPGNGVIWVTEQTGKIKIVSSGKVTGVLLDVADKMVKINGGYDERGLLGIALHPSFSSNKKFYIYYSAPGPKGSNHTTVVAEYKLAGADKADAASARIVLTQDEPEFNHNGGCLKFGKDGYLYISLGDGGGAGDKHGPTGNGQKLDTWLGKILRIDVNASTGYKVPADNPFVNNSSAKPEIWAYGLRNPYRMSFNRANGQLFAGDVGQDQWEEVDIITKGANYGWRLTEGTHCYNPSQGCDTKGITMPITEYSHREGISVTGGYVYNGTKAPGLKGKYIFADWSGPMFYLQNAGGVWQRGKLKPEGYPTNLKITCFGEDATGEVYWLTNPDTGPNATGGAVYRVAGQ